MTASVFGSRKAVRVGPWLSHQRLALVAGLGVSVFAGAVRAQPSNLDQPLPQPAPPESRQPPERAAAESPAIADPALRVPRHRISRVVLNYVRENPDHPHPDRMQEAVLRLERTPEGFVAAIPDGLPDTNLRLADIPVQTTNLFSDDALLLFAPAVVRQLQELGLIGVYVEPDPEQFRVVDGRIVDVRPEGVDWLTLNVTTGIVTEVRTVGIGERLPAGETVNNPVHERIRLRSPVRPYEDGDEERSDLLRRDLIDDYIYRLNRHPGRRVDVAVAAPGVDPGGVGLDYLVTENRPWFIFGQVSNTGTESTDDWRERVGFVHNQLTNNDDTFIIDFLTANFDEVNSLSISYERPLFDSDRWRGRAYGSWYEYTASELGLPDADFEGTGYSFGGELIWNFFQHRELFLDGIAGARWERVKVDNELAEIEGDDNFLVPYVGVRLERVREASRTFATLTYETNLSGIAGTNESTLDELGRTNAEADYHLLKFDASHSFFIEPLIDRDLRWAESLAHELVFSTTGQYSFNNRLIPNAEQAVGGLYSVRGYPEAIAAGDSVIAATAEYRFHLPRALGAQPKPGTLFGRPFRYRPQYAYGPTDWDLILRGFVDCAWVSVSNPEEFERDHRLLGAGVGVELAITRRFNVRMDYGWALEDLERADGDKEVDKGDGELYFVLTVVF